MSYRDSEFFQRSFERAQRDYDNQMPPEDPRDGMDEPEEHTLEDARQEREEVKGDAKFDLTDDR